MCSTHKLWDPGVEAMGARGLCGRHECGTVHFSLGWGGADEFTCPGFTVTLIRWSLCLQNCKASWLSLEASF